MLGEKRRTFKRDLIMLVCECHIVVVVVKQEKKTFSSSISSHVNLNNIYEKRYNVSLSSSLLFIHFIVIFLSTLTLPFIFIEYLLQSFFLLSLCTYKQVSILHLKILLNVNFVAPFLYTYLFFFLCMNK